MNDETKRTPDEELGDIDTPVVPFEDIEFGAIICYCPRCYDSVLTRPDRCKRCGQALDWTGYSRDEKTQPE